VLAVLAVYRELVSGQNSLKLGKIQGKISLSGQQFTHYLDISLCLHHVAIEVEHHPDPRTGNYQGIGHA